MSAARCTARSRAAIARLGRGVAAGLFVASPAFAGIGGSVVPSFPSPISVGETKTATITITNRSTAPNQNEDIAVSGIYFTPSCASSDGLACLSPDPGVFVFATIIGKTGTSCAGTVFAAGPVDPATGTFQLIPPANKPVVLGPSSGTGPKPRQCIIGINFQVQRAPLDSTPPDPPVTTESLGRATLQRTSGGSSGVAGGGSTVAISGVSPAPTADLSIAVTNGVTAITPGGGSQ